MSGKSKSKLLEQIVEESLINTGFELVMVEYKKEGNTWVLRVFVDHPEGMNLDRCSRATVIIDEVLEAKDPIEHEYNLEVSSPGVDRPLLKIDDFKRFLEERVFLKLRHAVSGTKQVTGKLVAVDEEGVEVLNEADQKTIRTTHDNITKATLKPILSFE